MESPCILVCSIDERTGWCFGCGRTKAEIGAWISYSPGERRSVMEALPGRVAQIERRPRRETRRAALARQREEDR